MDSSPFVSPRPLPPKPHSRHSSYSHTHLTSSPTYRPAPPPPHFATPNGSPSSSRRPAPPPPSRSPFEPKYYPEPEAGPSRPVNTRVFSAPTRSLPEPPAEPSFSTPSPSRSALKKLRPWSLAADRERTRWSDRSSGSASDRERGREESPSPAEYTNGDSSEGQDLTVKLGKGFARLDVNHKTPSDVGSPASDRGWPWGQSIRKKKPKEEPVDEGPVRPNGWARGDSEGTDEDTQPDAYSWVDPSFVGTDKLRATVRRGTGRGAGR